MTLLSPSDITITTLQVPTTNPTSPQTPTIPSSPLTNVLTILPVYTTGQVPTTLLGEPLAAQSITTETSHQALNPSSIYGNHSLDIAAQSFVPQGQFFTSRSENNPLIGITVSSFTTTPSYHPVVTSCPYNYSTQHGRYPVILSDSTRFPLPRFM
jgi:hypothetical protein